MFSYLTARSIKASGVMAASLIALCLSLNPAAAKDQTPPGYHELPLNIPDTATIKQSIIYTKSENKNGKPTSTSTQYEVFNKVTANTDSYTVTQKTGAFKFLSSTEFDVKTPETSPQYQMIKKMMRLTNDVTYTADAALMPVRIENWEKTRANLYDMMKTTFAGAGMPKEAVDNIMKGVNNLYGSLTAESAAEIFLPLDTLISMPKNVGLVLGEPLSNASQVMVPMFNIPLQATTELELTQWNPQQNLARLRYDYAPTAASMKSFVREGLPKAMVQMGAPADAVANFNKELATLKDTDVIQLTTHCDFDVAIDTGLITKGKCSKVVKMTIGATKANKTDEWEFSEALVK